MLLALTAKLFDSVPLDKMMDAEQAVQTAADTIPEDICERLDTADKLSDEDRKKIIDIARQSLVPFQPQSDVTDAQNKSPLPPGADKGGG
jgi:F-type H+-transporting ATPase subunit alpha